MQSPWTGASFQPYALPARRATLAQNQTPTEIKAESGTGREAEQRHWGIIHPPPPDMAVTQALVPWAVCNIETGDVVDSGIFPSGGWTIEPNPGYTECEGRPPGTPVPVPETDGEAPPLPVDPETCPPGTPAETCLQLRADERAEEKFLNSVAPLALGFGIVAAVFWAVTSGK